MNADEGLWDGKVEGVDLMLHMTMPSYLSFITILCCEEGHA